MSSSGVRRAQSGSGAQAEGATDSVSKGMQDLKLKDDSELRAAMKVCIQSENFPGILCSQRVARMPAIHKSGLDFPNPNSR